MPLWAALLPNDEPSSCSEASLAAIATWCLQFTPRVALLKDAVLAEVEASARLFGGKRQLARRIADEGRELGARSPSWAPTALGALALARAGRVDGVTRPLPTVIDRLPLRVLDEALEHAPTLERLGCRTLGDVRALPRGGVSRRFGAPLLAALDRAYGLRPDAFDWFAVPTTFDVRLELLSRVDNAPALLFGARRMLIQMCGWLAARRSGVTAFTLEWLHDAMRSSAVDAGGAVTIRTAQATRNIEHLSRLLAEHLAHVELAAPASDLRLIAVEVHALHEHSEALIPDAQEQGESLALVLERLAARLGPERVLRPVAQGDHRPEWMVHWQQATLAQPRKVAEGDDLPQPTFLLDEPIRLAARGDRPMYQGTLHLLAGPHRVEFGWWHRLPATDGAGKARLEGQGVVRDYWVALSEHAGVLWIFHTRLAGESDAWFLHGVFA